MGAGARSPRGNQHVPATRYAIGDSLFGMEAYPGREGQLDLVLWNERIRTVIAGDTLIDLGNGLEIPQVGCRKGSQSSRSRAGSGRCSTSPSSSCCRRTATQPTAPLSNASSRLICATTSEIGQRLFRNSTRSRLLLRDRAEPEAAVVVVDHRGQVLEAPVVEEAALRVGAQALERRRAVRAVG